MSLRREVRICVHGGGLNFILGSIPNGADPMVEWFFSIFYLCVNKDTLPKIGARDASEVMVVPINKVSRWEWMG